MVGGWRVSSFHLLEASHCTPIPDARYINPPACSSSFQLLPCQATISFGLSLDWPFSLLLAMPLFPKEPTRRKSSSCQSSTADTHPMLYTPQCNSHHDCHDYCLLLYDVSRMAIHIDYGIWLLYQQCC